MKPALQADGVMSEQAASNRPKPCRYVDSISPERWTDTPLYFDVFQLLPSGNWQVALIAERNGNRNRLSQLRAAASFLKRYRWILPSDSVVGLGVSRTAVVYQREYGQQLDDPSGIIEAKRLVSGVLDDPGWEAVFAVP
jgi:hypothetical protein